MKRVALALGGVTLIALVLICSRSWWRSEPRVYVKPLNESINTLDPAKTRFRPDYMITRAIQGQLISLDSLGEIKPALLESWEVNRAGTEYTFHVRSGVVFHSGKKAGVADAIYTLHYLASRDSLVNQLFSDIQGFDAYVSGRAARLAGIAAVDARTFKVTLNDPSFIFLANLADPKIAVVPDGLNGLSPSEFFKRPDGIGPFRFASFDTAAEVLELDANPSYYLGPPRLDKIRFQRMALDQAVAAFKRGEIHDLEPYAVPPQEHPQLQTLGLQYSVSAYANAFLFFNGRNSLFRDIDARRKIAQTINVTPVGEACGLSFIKSWGFIPHGILGWADPKYGAASATPPKTTPAWPRPLRVLAYGDDFAPCIIEGFVQQLKAAGIPVIYEHIESAQIIERLERGDYDMFFESLSVRGSEPYHLTAYFRPGSRHNIIYFNDPKIGELSDKIKTSPAKQVRATLYRELDTYLTNEKAYFVPLFSDLRHYFFAKNVTGATVPALISLNNGFEEIGLE